MRIRKVYRNPYSRAKKKTFRRVEGPLPPRKKPRISWGAVFDLALAASIIIGIGTKRIPDPYDLLTKAPAHVEQVAPAAPPVSPYMCTPEQLDKPRMSFSANQVLRWANNNVNLLQARGYDACLEETHVQGKLFYRTVVPDTEKNLDNLTSRLNWDSGRTLEKITRCDGKPSLPSLGIEVNHFECLAESIYIPVATGYIKSYHRGVAKKKNVEMPSDEYRRDIAGAIYNYAFEFDNPVLIQTALPAKESAFRDVEGDLKYKNKKDPSKSAHAEGIYQMRKPTQEFVWTVMQRKGVKGLPDELPPTLIGHTDLQTRMGAAYFSICREMAGGDMEKAIQMYNDGHNIKTFENTLYVQEVSSQVANLARKMQKYHSSQV